MLVPEILNTFPTFVSEIYNEKWNQNENLQKYNIETLEKKMKLIKNYV